ncbi:hypothetical protein DRH27_01830 [Candidatus Falkowbacteria bacterium]|nr:MAG: hypothetical protein DRH27_01830 [Candidatus Falkowbacteria bacterium]
MDNIIDKTKLKEAIFQTIVFFDMFDYPLSLFEIWQYLKFKCDIADIQIILGSRHDLRAEPSVIDRIDEKNGLYFLAGRGRIYETRLKRYNFTERKFKRLLLVARIFKIIPWIKMIAMGNMMGASNLKDNGDIDLFIITEKKRAWITRLFCVSIIKLLKLRPEPDNERDKICLSFFISESGMDLRGLMLNEDRRSAPNKENLKLTHDIYFIYWLINLAPVYDKNGIYKKFIHENNWVHFFVPNWRPAETVGRRQVGKSLPSIYRDIVDMLIGGLEINVKKWQLKIMPEVLARPLNKDTQVVANDNVIKLHANDRREEYREKWIERVKQYR